MGSEDDVDVIEIGEKTLAITLGDATTHRDHTMPARRLREALAGGALTVQARICSLAHAARHENDDIGVLGSTRLKATERVEQPAHALGVMEVHLTAEGADEIRLTGEDREVSHEQTCLQSSEKSNASALEIEM